MSRQDIIKKYLIGLPSLDVIKYDYYLEGKTTIFEGEYGKIAFSYLLSNGNVIFSQDGKFYFIEPTKAPKIFGPEHDTVISTIVLEDDTIIFGCIHGDIDVWDAKTQTYKFTLIRNLSPVFSIYHLPNNRLLTVNDINVATLWDFKNQIRLRDFYVSRLIDVSDQLLYAKECNVEVWDLEGNILKYTINNYFDKVTAIKCLDDGRVVTGDAAENIKIWRKGILEYQQYYGDTILGFNKISNAKLIICELNICKYWNLATRKIFKDVFEHGLFALLPNDSIIGNIPHYCGLRVFDCELEEFTFNLKFDENYGEIFSVSSNGKVLVTTVTGKIIVVS